jgi:hypothetical protein
MVVILQFSIAENEKPLRGIAGEGPNRAKGVCIHAKAAAPPPGLSSRELMDG